MRKISITTSLLSLGFVLLTTWACDSLLESDDDGRSATSSAGEDAGNGGSADDDDDDNGENSGSGDDGSSASAGGSTDGQTDGPMVDPGASCEERVATLTSWLYEDLGSCMADNDCQLLLSPDVQCPDGCQGWFGINQDAEATLTTLTDELAILDESECRSLCGIDCAMPDPDPMQWRVSCENRRCAVRAFDEAAVLSVTRDSEEDPNAKLYLRDVGSVDWIEVTDGMEVCTPGATRAVDVRASSANADVNSTTTSELFAIRDITATGFSVGFESSGTCGALPGVCADDEQWTLSCPDGLAVAE